MPNTLIESHPIEQTVVITGKSIPHSFIIIMPHFK